MVHEILQKVETIIHARMIHKFGLTQEESERSTKAFKEEVTAFVQHQTALGGNLLENALGNLQQIGDTASFNEFKEKVAAALEEKAGLSPDMAAKVRDFSITTLFQTFGEELTDEHGRVNIGKLLDRLNLGQFETTARDFLESFSQRLSGK
jgi:hypothetical protein